MRIKEGFVLREVSGAQVVVPVGAVAREFRAVVNLNGTAAFLFAMLAEGAKREELIAGLLRRYAVGEDRAARDVDALIGQLRGAGMLSES